MEPDLSSTMAIFTGVRVVSLGRAKPVRPTFR